MKAIRILSVACVFFAFATNVLADELTVDNVSIKPGETKEVAVELSNPDRAYTLLEFTMTLPEGVSIVQNNGFAVSLNSSRCNGSFSIEVNEEANHSYKFLIYSGSLDDITGTSGQIFTMALMADSEAPTGQFQGVFSEQLFATADDYGFEPADKTFSIKVGGLRGDVNGDGAVNVSDVTSLVSMILGNTPQNDVADVSGDGAVNVSDVTALVSIILGN